MEVEEALRLLVAEYSRMAETYDRHAAPYHAALVDRLLDLTEPRRGERVLDLGCGTGNLAFAAVRRVGVEGFVAGVDLADGMVRFAAAKAVREGLRNVKFERMDCRDLAFPHRNFDVAVSCLGIPGVQHGRSFAEVHRVLRAGGRFAFCVWTGRGTSPPFRELIEKFRPSRTSPGVQGLLEGRRRIVETGEPAAMRDPDALRAMLEELGFRDVRIAKETHRIVYPTLDAYLNRSFAWGDNEREWRAMSPDAREAFRREFAEGAASLLTEEGLVSESEALYTFAGT